MDAYRQLLVLGINKLVDQGLISLTPTGNDRADPTENGHLISEIEGEKAVINWWNVGFDELRVSVWWKYDHNRHPQANAQGQFREAFHTSLPLARRELYSRFVGVTASGFIERKEGIYLVGKGSTGIFDIYVRRGERAALDALPKIEPIGYRAERHAA